MERAAKGIAQSARSGVDGRCGLSDRSSPRRRGCRAAQGTALIRDRRVGQHLSRRRRRRRRRVVNRPRRCGRRRRRYHHHVSRGGRLNSERVGRRRRRVWRTACGRQRRRGERRRGGGHVARHRRRRRRWRDKWTFNYYRLHWRRWRAARWHKSNVRRRRVGRRGQNISNVCRGRRGHGYDPIFSNGWCAVYIGDACVLHGWRQCS